MKPFNLDAALRGEPICDRDGKPMMLVCYIPNAQFAREVLAISYDKGAPLYDYGIHGRWFANGTTATNLDLCMATKPEEMATPEMIGAGQWKSGVNYPAPTLTTPQADKVPAAEVASEELAMMLRRLIVAARRHCEGDSPVLSAANTAWQMLHRMSLLGSPLRDEIASTPPAKPAAEGASDAAAKRIDALMRDRGKRIYIAGPMTGLPEFNFPAFNAKAAELRAEGWHVENPAEHGHVDGAGWSDYLRYDLTNIATCGAIYLLEGWQKSKGARLEVHVATALGMEFHGATPPSKVPQEAQPVATVEMAIKPPHASEAWLPYKVVYAPIKWLDSVPVGTLLYAAPQPARAETPINDKAHPRFIAGYEAGLHDGHLDNDKEPARAGAVELSESSADDLRAMGWSVAVHNDYRLNDGSHTFWLVTKGDRAIKGEGKTDSEALNQIRAILAAATTAATGDDAKCANRYRHLRANYIPALSDFDEDRDAIDKAWGNSYALDAAVDAAIATTGKKENING